MIARRWHSVGWALALLCFTATGSADLITETGCSGCIITQDSTSALADTVHQSLDLSAALSLDLDEQSDLIHALSAAPSTEIPDGQLPHGPGSLTLFAIGFAMLGSWQLGCSLRSLETYRLGLHHGSATPTALHAGLIESLAEAVAFYQASYLELHDARSSHSRLAPVGALKPSFGCLCAWSARPPPTQVS